MAIFLKRAYESPKDADGHRVLVDRLWPRGISKQSLAIDHWMKDVAPSNELRKAFHNGGISWGEFRRRYLAELKTQREILLRPLVTIATRRRVTLVFSAADENHNNAVVVKQYLQMLGANKKAGNR